jgi:hypothetical protein
LRVFQVMKNKVLVWLLAVLGGAGLRPALAQEIGPFRRPLAFTLLAGTSTSLRFGSLVPLPLTADVPDISILLEPKTTEWGVRLGCYLTRRVEIQGTVTRLRAGIVHHVGIGLAGIPLGKTEVAGASTWSLSGGLAYYLGGMRLSPYLALGAGAANLDIEGAGAKTRLLFEFGAGAKVPLWRRFRAVLDVRDVVTFFRYFEDFRFAYPLIYRFEGRDVQHSLKARLGLEFFF